jgi:hypothetical protein
MKLTRRAKRVAARLLGGARQDAPSLEPRERDAPIQAAAESNGSVPASAFTVFSNNEIRTFFEPSASPVGEIAVAPATARRVMEINSVLEWDDNIGYARAYYTTGLDRFGDAWRYADISTAFLAAAELAQPKRYLEIGVRRSHSLAMVVAAPGLRDRRVRHVDDRLRGDAPLRNGLRRKRLQQSSANSRAGFGIFNLGSRRSTDSSWRSRTSALSSAHFLFPSEAGRSIRSSVRRSSSP